MKEKVALQYHKRPALINGSVSGIGTGFIIWIFASFGIIVPPEAAAFMAGILVPVIEYLLQKLTYKEGE